MSELETGTDHLLGRIEGRVAVLTLNRPERRNALSPEFYAGMERALPQIAADNDIRVLMMTGTGGAFCAGGDVKRMNDENEAGTRNADGYEYAVTDLRRRQRQVSLSLHEMPKPVVAAIDGAAAGAGFSIAMAADVRIASPKALLVTAFANVGASGDFGGSWFLSRLLGEARAKHLYFTSPRLDAAASLDIGLVSEILDSDDFDAAAVEWCAALAERAPLAMRYMKENINRASNVDLATALDAEAPNMVRTMSSADHREAASAFVEKRSATFHGS